MSAATNTTTANEATTQSPFDKYSQAVSTNPLDFNSWVQLLAVVESDKSSITVETARETFNRLLNEFPLCFGYWNKFALYEMSLSRSDTIGVPPKLEMTQAIVNSRKVYERGVAAVGYSVDMWLNYINYLIDTVNVSIDEARSTLERAIEMVGADPAAGRLWEKYILFETTNNEMEKLHEVFKRIMATPLSDLASFWEKYNHFVMAQNLSTLATAEELAALETPGDANDEGALRVKLVAQVERIKDETMTFIQNRAIYEAGIERSYFHVTPLSENTLSIWRKYLDYEESTGDDDRTMRLYERCMIVCANYSEFWTRYADWIEAASGIDDAENVYQRACTTFLKYRADMYFRYAEFLEAQDRISEARQQYVRAKDGPAANLVEGLVAFANFERRLGNVEKAEALLEEGVENNVLQDDARAFLFLQLAMLQRRVSNDVEAARSTYKRAIAKVSGVKALWLSYAQFEANQVSSDTVDRVRVVYSLAVAESSKLTADDKCDLWFHFEEYMANFASDINEVRSVRRNEVSWKKSKSISKKRGLVTANGAYQNKVARQNSSGVVSSSYAPQQYTAAQYAAYYQQHQQ